MGGSFGAVVAGAVAAAAAFAAGAHRGEVEDEFMVRCTVCGGRGEILQGYAGEYSMTRIECPRCRGLCEHVRRDWRTLGGFVQAHGARESLRLLGGDAKEIVHALAIENEARRIASLMAEEGEGSDEGADREPCCEACAYGAGCS